MAQLAARKVQSRAPVTRRVQTLKKAKPAEKARTKGKALPGKYTGNLSEMV